MGNVFSVREAAKKGSSTNGQAIKRGGGGKGQTIKEKGTFSIYFLDKLKIKVSISIEGTRLMAWPIIEKLFLRLP